VRQKNKHTHYRATKSIPKIGYKPHKMSYFDSKKFKNSSDKKNKKYSL